MSPFAGPEVARLSRFLTAHQDRFALALVRIPQVPLRAEFAAHIESWCAEHGRPFLHFKLAGLTPFSVWDRISARMPVGAVAIMDDLDAAVYEPEGLLAPMLNLQRERIAELLPGPVLLVLSDGAIDRFFLDAPDLADWHAAKFEFEGPVSPTLSGVEMPPIPERSAEWIESRIALLENQREMSMPDASRARLLTELGRLYQDSVYAVPTNRDFRRAREAFEAFQLAESALREALEIRRRLPDKRDLVRAIASLARLLREGGRFTDAEPLRLEALEICESALGDDDTFTLGATNDLAWLYREQGRYAEAERLFKHVLSSRQRLLGEEHPDTLRTARKLAGVYRLEGRSAEAEPLCRNALQSTERVLGPEHRDTLISMHDLASLYIDLGRYAEASALYEGALAINEKLRGGEHPDTLGIAHNLVSVCAKQGQNEKAERLAKRVLASHETLVGAEHPTTLMPVTSLAGVYQAQGRYAEAEPLFRRALDGFQSSFGPDHPLTIVGLNNLGALYSAMGQQKEAEALLSRAASAAEKILGPDHPNTKRYRSNLDDLRKITAPSSPSSPETAPDRD